MGEIRLDNCCRLCLKEGFSLTNIFSHSSAAGDPLYRILNFIYDIKISENDGLPSQICSPCMWRMIEFDACKRNVRSAEAEIMRLLTQMRPHIIEVSNDGEVLVAKESEMDSTGEVRTEGSIVHSEAPVKEEINVLEWENPIETEMEGHIPEALQKFEDDDLESTEVEADEVPVEEFEDNCNQHVFCQPLRESPQLPKASNSLTLDDSDATAGHICFGESNSIITTPENYVRIRDTNKRTCEKDVRDYIVQVHESQSAEQPKSVLNFTEAGPSHLEVSLSNMKNRFICDFCRKSFQFKSTLSRHVRVHYEDRLFSCSVCCKRFKLDTVRYHHELRHLRDTMSDEKSEKRSMKKPFSCGICGRNFVSRKGLKGHLNQHDKKYSCRACGNTFGSNANLKRHLIVHTKEKPFECLNCFKSFNAKSNLTQHMLTHSSDRLFSCKTCKKNFKTKAVKNCHELMHLRKKSNL